MTDAMAEDRACPNGGPDHVRGIVGRKTCAWCDEPIVLEETAIDRASGAVERASLLGQEHGKAAGEAWLKRGWNPAMVDQILTHPKLRIAGGYKWPVPDLSGDTLVKAIGYGGWYNFPHEQAAYEAAFTAAVEATVREACERAS